MGKTPAMRAGVALMALALITSSFVGTTLAKYTTSDSGSDTARVAKFGVTVTATGETFAKTYKGGTIGYTTNDVVISGTDDKVVAPGTYGALTGISITGTPEVAVKVSYEATKFDLGDNWIAKGTGDENESYYCPLVIHIRNSKETGDDKKTTLSGLSYDSADEFEEAVKAEIKKYEVVYGPGTNLANKNGEYLTIDWAWPFESGEDTDKAANNVKDTYLGDQAAKGKAATVTLELTTTVTQID